MAGDTEVPITPGTGADIAGYLDTAGNVHQKFILEMQGPTDPQDPVKINSSNPLPITLVPGSVGTTRSRINSAATTNATNVKAAAGDLLAFELSNQSTGYRYVKFYDAATAPTVGTTAVAFVITIPPGGMVSPDYTAAGGIPFTTGISYAITAGTGLDADTTAVAAADVSGFLLTK
jgi:hypothetical protein